MTLEEAALASASLRLFDKVLASSYDPTHIVAIASGGVHVAKPMASRADPSVAFVEVLAQRPSTARKRASPIARILRRLPYFVTDRLRLLEAWLLERLYGREPVEELEELSEPAAAQLAGIPADKDVRVLVVDDAVDSGSTLYRVVGGLAHVKTAGGEVRSAVLTVTGPRPLIRPDFYLFERVICRCPWSYDFKR